MTISPETVKLILEYNDTLSDSSQETINQARNKAISGMNKDFTQYGNNKGILLSILAKDIANLREKVIDAINNLSIDSAIETNKFIQDYQFNVNKYYELMQEVAIKENVKDTYLIDDIYNKTQEDIKDMYNKTNKYFILESN